MPSLLLYNIGQIATPRGFEAKRGAAMQELDIIPNAAILIEQGVITRIGDSQTLLATLNTAQALLSGDNKPTINIQTLDAQGMIAVPGFVDSHTHTVFAGDRANEFAMRSEGKTYQEIAAAGGGIVSTMNATRTATQAELVQLGRERLGAMLHHGTTTVEIKSGYGLDTASELTMLAAIHELRTNISFSGTGSDSGAISSTVPSTPPAMTIVPTFLGAHAFPPEFRDTHKTREEYVRIVIEEMLPAVKEHNYAVFCDIFCEQNYFDRIQSERILQAAHGLGFGLKVHADQLSASGAVELAVQLGAISADHLEYTTESGIQALQRSSTIATILPGSSLFLAHRYAPARAMIDAGCAVALATDFNPGSSMTYSMPMMMTLACTQMRVTPAEALTAATLNGAAALRLAHERGSIEVGKRADIALFRVPDYRYIAYHFAENHCQHVIANGVLLH